MSLTASEHRWWMALARWSLGLVLGVWLVCLAGWVALHGFIVPRIGEFRPQLEEQASAMLGIPVRIGSIVAQSAGLIPSFELTDVVLLDRQNRPALQLPRVLVALSPRSVWQLGFEQMYIERPQLSVRRDALGQVTVAGLDFSQPGDSAHALADWFFSQIEFVIRDGTIAWTDELRGAPTLALTQVDFVVRNRIRRHEIRLDATPPMQWGDRFTLRGIFAQPLLTRHNGKWQDWDGQLYASFDRVDLALLRLYVDPGFDLRQGNGALRSWVDVQRGQFTGVVADVALGEVQARLGADLQPLDVRSVFGRMGGRRLDGGFEFSTEGLRLDTDDGLHWPGGNVFFSYLEARGKTAAQGRFEADQLDLAALAQIAQRLPLEADLRAAVHARAPSGRIEHLQVSWEGLAQAPVNYRARGRVQALVIASVGHVPGVRGLSADFDLNQGGGRATLSMQDGAVDLPGVFEEPVIHLSQLSGDLRWQILADQLALQVPNLKFANADAQGEAQIKWESADPVKSAARSKYPGVLDLQAMLSRVNGTRVYRYLPLVVNKAARDYVSEAVLGGTASGAKFRVRGDLYHMPFSNPRDGEFRISAQVHDATLAYVPHSLQTADAAPWPVLTQLDGELVIERSRLQVRDARARIGAGHVMQLSKIEAEIPELNHAVVQVSAEARGPLSEGLGIVTGSPLNALTGHALVRASATGNADIRLKLQVPVAMVDRSTVQGSVALNGNDVQITPDTPKLTRVRGTIGFSESGFAVGGAVARMLGGEVRIEGGTTPVAGRLRGPAMSLRATGTLSAEGLRQAKELGLASRLAQYASGSTGYTAVLAVRRGEPELSVSSSLQGLGLNLPAPLNKTAEASLPLRLETALLPGVAGAARLSDQFTLEIGRLVSVVYVRDLGGAEPRVLRGSLAVGLSQQEAAPLPEEGVVANVQGATLDLDAWGAVLSQSSGAGWTDVGASGGASSYLPTVIALRAGELRAGGRVLHDLVAGGSREGLLWRANLSAAELNGYAEYRQRSDAGAGRLYARLARLVIAPSAASEVEALLEEQPASIPAMDIVVEDFELRGKHMGRLEVEAINRGAGVAAREGIAREWRLNKFNLVTPEAVLSGAGNWAAVGATRNKGVPEQRRTVLNFKLDIHDGGALLARMGMQDVVRKGHGKMEGQIAWLGSPMTLDYASMTGSFNVNVEAGQFLKADPGIAKLLGVLSLQALPRRLVLDFRDVFSEGFAFDFLRGDVGIDHGIASTNNLQMKGVNAAVLMEGRADVAKETQDIRVVVIPEVNAGTASLIASVINPAVGIGTFLAQLFLRKPLAEAATQEFHVDGSWADPRITKVPRAQP